MTKRVRLPGGKWVSRKLAESSPLSLQNAKPEEIWDAGDGRKLLVRDMDTSHLAHAIGYLERKALLALQYAGMSERFDPKVFAAKSYPVYNVMKVELEKRLTQQDAMTHEKKLPERAMRFDED